MATRATPRRRVSDDKLVAWKDRDTERLTRSLALAMKLLVVENGEVLSHEPFRFDAAAYVVTSLVQLGGITNGQAVRGLVRNACFRLRKSEQRDVSAFRQVLAECVREHLGIAEHLYRVIFLLNVDPLSLGGRRQFSSTGLRFAVRTWPQVQKMPGAADWLSDVGFDIGLVEPALSRTFLPLEVRVRGRTQDEAFRAATAAYDLLRATLNLRTFGRYTHQFGMPRPLGEVSPSPAYGIFLADGTYAMGYVDTGQPREHRRCSVSPDQLRNSDRLLRQFGRPRQGNTTIALAEDAIRRYGQAHDTTDWQVALLARIIHP
jgi:hypothetical protein